MRDAHHRLPSSALRPQGPSTGSGRPASPPPGGRPSTATTPLEYLGMAALVAVAALGILVAAAAQLSTRVTAGQWLSLSSGDWGAVLVALPASPADPAAAFPPSAQHLIVGPWPFWTTLGLLALAPVLGACLLLRRRAGARRAAGPQAANWASRRDTKPLYVRQPTPGRLILGQTGRRLAAAEAGQSVAVIGPTRSGKTTGLAVPAILEWAGPVIATSVKTDLLRDTLGWRRQQGTVWVYDPTATTGLPAATWSPLAACTTWQGARRVASGMAATARESGNAGGLSDGDFWHASAAKLLGPLLFAAAYDGYTMADVVRWIDTQDQAEPAAALERAGVAEALNAAKASWQREPKQRSSVYTTAETIVEAYADPAVAASARSCDITPEQLLDGGNHTLYLCAPYDEQKRLRPVFTALLQTILSAVYQRAHETGEPLSPSLLLALDEAANIAPLTDLDAVASTGAGQGIQLMSVWQDLTQMRARYGDRAHTILNNHRATMLLPGIKDPATLEHASRLVGDADVSRPSTTWDAHGQRSTTEGVEHRRLAPDHALRTLPDGQAVVIYGSMAPLRVQLRPWYDDRALSTRARRNDDRDAPCGVPLPTWAAPTAGELGAGAGRVPPPMRSQGPSKSDGT